MNGGGCCGGGCCGIAICGIIWQTSGPQEPQYQTGRTPGGTVGTSPNPPDIGCVCNTPGIPLD
eukprot:4313822-Prorocentrum_lima.AAC.1